MINELKNIDFDKQLLDDNYTIKAIAGKLNNCRTIYYWLIDKIEEFKIGDYAIVENMNDYDLIKIVGIIETNKKYMQLITNSSNLKSVVKILSRDEIRED